MTDDSTKIAQANPASPSEPSRTPPVAPEKITPPEKLSISAMTGFKIGKASLHLFPSKNPVHLSYGNGIAGLQAEISAGNSGLKVNEFATHKHDGKATYQAGILKEYTTRSASVLGNSSPAAPMLGDMPSVAPGGGNGLGVRGATSYELADGASLKLQAQVTTQSPSSYLADPSKQAPGTFASAMVSDRSSTGGYAVGTSYFMDRGKPATQIAVMSQNELPHGLNLNLTAEGIYGSLQKVKRLGVEVSKSTDGGITPYASAYLTKASGTRLPDGIADGTTRAVNFGIAKDYGKELRGFIQGHAETGQKPSVQVGITLGDMSAGTTIKGRNK